MTENKRYKFYQNRNYHTVIDENEGRHLITLEFKENEFGSYACFHKIIDLLNEYHNMNEELESKVNEQRVYIDFLLTENDDFRNKCLSNKQECSDLKKTIFELKQVIRKLQRDKIWEKSRDIKNDLVKLDTLFESDDINDLIKYCEKK